jgi:thienamycin biosynthesis protein ThnN
MSASSELCTVAPDCSITDDRVRQLVDRHFHPEHGSPYWISVAARLEIDARRELRTREDLSRLGRFDERALANRSIFDFLPRSVLGRRSDLVVVETGGTLGSPKRAVFLEETFRAAFVDPFLAALESIPRFPRDGASWLYIGPSGPHAIGKAAREVARALGSPDPFAVDFDPRWYKRQRLESIIRRRYLDHLVDQACGVLRSEPVAVLFTTPPVALAIARSLGDSERERIRGLHLGGLAATADDARSIDEAFPSAAIVGGFGNSLFGLVPPIVDGHIADPIYYPHGRRLHLRLIAEDGAATDGRDEVGIGQRGRVLASRFDDELLIVDLLERDTAVHVPVAPALSSRGFVHHGLGGPRPLEVVKEERLGIY